MTKNTETNTVTKTPKKVKTALPENFSNDAMYEAFKTVEASVLMDVKEMNRITSDIRLLQARLKSLKFKYKGQFSIECGIHLPRLAWSFDKKQITCQWCDAETDAFTIKPLLEMPMEIRVEMHATYLPQLLLGLSQYKGGE